MNRWPLTFIIFFVATHLNTIISLKLVASDDEVIVSTQRHKYKQDSHNPSKEWIKAPNGFLYQFHVGDQSWLTAREFCLSQNSDLAILRDNEQIGWLLKHYAPTYPRFNERYIQIGLILPDGPDREWTYVDGSKYNQSTIEWMSGEPFDHSVDGRERCGLLRVHSRLLDDVDCEETSRPHVRFICERSDDVHKQQQRSSNYLWRKLEELLEYFGIGSGAENTKLVANATKKEDDYYDKEHVKIVPNRTKEIRNMKIKNQNSEEEERSVLTILKKLGKPGLSSESKRSQGDQSESSETSSPDGLQNSVDSSTKDSTTPFDSSDSSVIRESEALVENSTSPVVATNNFPSEETTLSDKLLVTASSHTVESFVTENDAFVGTTVTPEANVAMKKESVRATKDSSASVHAAPLRTIAEREGSGEEIGRSDFEDSSKLYHEIDPSKLEQVISTMEKMIEKLENITIVEKKDGNENKTVIVERTTITGLNNNENQQKEADEKKKKDSNESLTKISGKAKADMETQIAMEEDFNEDLNKNVPTTDIRPPSEEDCEDEGSGEFAIEAPSEAVFRNVVDTEDIDTLSQKPKIPADREEHVQEFLQTLRTFLSRAEHNDLKKLLDDNSGKTLLEKMKLAISAANDREFNRLRELEQMKQSGIDVSKLPEPERMPDTVREELFKKIRGVVISEAEKLSLETVTEPSPRTTTQETLRKAKIVKEKEQIKDGETWKSTRSTTRAKEFVEKAIVKGDIKKDLEAKSVKDKSRSVQEAKENVAKSEAKQADQEKQQIEGATDSNTKADKQQKDEANKQTSESDSSTEKLNDTQKEKQLNKSMIVKKEEKSTIENEKKLQPRDADALTTVDSEVANNKSEVEVKTEKTPASSVVEKSDEKNEKKNENSTATNHSKEENNNKPDIFNPLGLPTLSPPVTLAPLPSLKSVLESLALQWQKLFTPPKSASKL
ncbi:lectin C-type domain protein [Dictyocaulus viviparus]|uniref:Lectin C-type domain protein n=1 Tax=Dictyocaulus viviparus TaxID=29172 RepID=A0A0D8YDN7_DICVI|nr:lectin C-type domain protein [Dictyocaulus viviparus]